MKIYLYLVLEISSVYKPYQKEGNHILISELVVRIDPRTPFR